MQQTVTSLFAEKHPDMVQQLVLLHPVRNLPDGARGNMRARATAASSASGLAGIANTVASTGVAKATLADYSACAFIRHLVATTDPAAYAAACLALASTPPVAAASLSTPLHIIGGREDYLAGPEAVAAWAAEARRGTSEVLDDVGHWGAIEAPRKVGAAIATAVNGNGHGNAKHKANGISTAAAANGHANAVANGASTQHHLLMGTFRSPYLYTLTFDTATRKLNLVHTNKAVGGHNWLDVSRDGRTLYTTNWGDEPSVSSYSIVARSAPVTQLQRTVKSKYLSGYVCSNAKAMYSACGPQVDVFLLDADGQLKQEAAAQSFPLVSEAEMHKGAAQLDFGGLRHGGHSADLSPDGSKLYVADIGRNCVWLYDVDQTTGLLSFASKNAAKRPDDGPRHCWPHPAGELVYSLQEHTSFVDVLRLTSQGTGARLEWVQGASILPPGADAKLYWADEVRLSPGADVLFGSVRGLEPGTLGHVAAWRLNGDGTLCDPVAAAKGDAAHRFETRTSGGWANAIAVCPAVGPKEEVYLTLTDSEEGFVQVLEYTADGGFEVVDEVKVGSEEEPVGAATAVWL